MAKILLIEDDKLIIKLYTGKLIDEGFEVVSAENGPVGLQMARKHKPNLILLDILMPGGLHGLSVLDILKKDQELQSIPVIILTNLDSQKMIALLKGASEYIIKANTDPSEIISLIKKHLKT